MIFESKLSETMSSPTSSSYGMGSARIKSSEDIVDVTTTFSFLGIKYALL